MTAMQREGGLPSLLPDPQPAHNLAALSAARQGCLVGGLGAFVPAELSCSSPGRVSGLYSAAF